MPEIYTEDALAQLQEQARSISVAIGELMEYRRYEERFLTAEKARMVASIKSNASAGGVDLTDWNGASTPR